MSMFNNVMIRSTPYRLVNATKIQLVSLPSHLSLLKTTSTPQNVLIKNLLYLLVLLWGELMGSRRQALRTSCTCDRGLWGKMIWDFLVLNTLNIVFGVTYYVKLSNAIIIYCESHLFYEQRLNCLFRHYNIFIFLFGKNRIYSILWVQRQ